VSETLWRNCEERRSERLAEIRTEGSNAASGRIPGTGLQAFGSADDAWVRETLQIWVWRSRIMWQTPFLAYGNIAMNGTCQSVREELIEVLRSARQRPRARLPSPDIEN
jgi:hypothetical protein